MEYCKTRNQAKPCCRKAVREFEKSIASEAKSKPNNFSCSVFAKENLENIPAFEDRHFQESLSDISFTKEDVLQMLKSLKINKFPGPDGHHPHVLQEMAEALADPLISVLNKILSTGTLPQLWKYANVTPFFKKSKKSSPSNYRPVSLTSVICKLMESLVRDHIVKHMNRNSQIQWKMESIQWKPFTWILLGFCSVF